MYIKYKYRSFIERFSIGNVKIRRSLLSSEDLMLLAKLEEANRILEADTKSLNSLSGTSCHSRKSSDTSQISLTSGEFPLIDFSIKYICCFFALKKQMSCLKLLFYKIKLYIILYFFFYFFAIIINLCFYFFS